MSELRYFMAGYAHEAGFGRMFFRTADPITDLKIVDWEEECRKKSGRQSVCIIALTPIDHAVMR
jgi:hypothetical protein